MNDLNIPKEVLNHAIIQELNLLGVRNGVLPKRFNKTTQASKPLSEQGQVFSKPLQRLSSRIVSLNSGVKAEVPNFIIEVCSCILKHADVEGLFRKGGSSARQKELRIVVDEGHRVDYSQHHVIDVANLLKCFLRELPEPLLPYVFHETFLHCLLVDDALEAVLLICLLLPRSNLHVLAYIMEFFQTIAGFSAANRMDCNNLAIVLAPSVMPITLKVSVIQNPQRLAAHVRVVELLISNADRIGVLPNGVAGRLSLTSSVSNLSLLSDDQNFGHSNVFSSKKKRRRSGSLTRMFNGLKKIVGGKLSPEIEMSSAAEEEAALVSSTPDFSTPCVKASKKRKASTTTSAFSNKKKRDVLQGLPQSTALANTPFKHVSQMQEVTALTTPIICSHPNPLSKSPPKVKRRKILSTRFELEKSGVPHSRKGLLGVSSLVSKKQKQNGERRSAGGSFLERSWSAVSSSSWGRRKQPSQRRSDTARLSLASTSSTACDYSSHDADLGVDLSEEDPSLSSPSDFVRVPKTEYEELKSRMSAIESRISHEFGSVLSVEPSPSEELGAASSALAVQTAYEKTLEDADVAKDSSTDVLARRLSRELKIRRSGEGKVMRSPSARKIGSLRRRSRERQSPSVRRELRRNKSWHNIHRSSSTGSVDSWYAAQQQGATGLHGSGSNLRRGRPNTVFSGLRHPTPTRMGSRQASAGVGTIQDTIGESQARRTASFHASESLAPRKPAPKKCNSQVTIAKAALLAHAQQNGREVSEEAWRDAQELLSRSKLLLDLAPVTRRESIAKLRNANAGKVLATAKLFNANVSTELAVKPAESRRSGGRGSGAGVAVAGSREAAKCDSSTGTPDGRGDHSTQRLGEGNELSMTSSGKPIGRATRFPSQTPGSNPPSPRKSTTPRNVPVAGRGQKPLQTRTPTVQSVYPAQRSAQQRVKKHSSLKSERKIYSQPVKRNQSAPVQRADAGKENVIKKSPKNVASFTNSPLAVNEAPMLPEKCRKISVSPLKDCNRIGVQSQPPMTSKFFTNSTSVTPSIKQPLTRRSPRLKAFPSQSTRASTGLTPLRAHTPVAPTPRRQSPRMLHQGVRPPKQLCQ